MPLPTQPPGFIGPDQQYRPLRRPQPAESVFYVPLPVTIAALLSIALPGVQTGVGVLTTIAAGTPISGHVWTTGDHISAIELNRMVLRTDLVGRFGGGGAYHVQNGLAISQSSGLTLAIEAGQANIDGPVEYAGGTLTMPGSHAGPTDRIFVWLSQAGVPSIVTNSIVPPAGAQLLLGSVTTNSSTITAVDFSGVLYARGSRLVRYVGDTTRPTDTPNVSVRYVARNPLSKQEWEWTGSDYRTMPSLTNPLTAAEGGTGTSAAVAPSAGTYGSATQTVTLTVDALGRVTTVAQQTATPAFSSITSKPTTLAGYGITDGATGTILKLGVVSGGAAFSWPAPTPLRAVIFVDATGGNINTEIPTLPAISGWNAQIEFVKVDASANTVTIRRGSTDTIMGATTYVLTTQWQAIMLDNDGVSQWFGV